MGSSVAASVSPHACIDDSVSVIEPMTRRHLIDFASLSPTHDRLNTMSCLILPGPALSCLLLFHSGIRKLVLFQGRGRLK